MFRLSSLQLRAIDFSLLRVASSVRKVNSAKFKFEMSKLVSIARRGVRRSAQFWNWLGPPSSCAAALDCFFGRGGIAEGGKGADDRVWYRILPVLAARRRYYRRHCCKAIAMTSAAPRVIGCRQDARGGRREVKKNLHTWNIPLQLQDPLQKLEVQFLQRSWSWSKNLKNLRSFHSFRRFWFGTLNIRLFTFQV